MTRRRWARTRLPAIDVLANDTDVDGGPKSVASVTQPANGTVVITGGGAGLTYEPDPNYCNSPPGGTPDTFTYTLNGGDSATVSVTVTCVDDAPARSTTARPWPRTRPRARSTCWPTTPMSTAGRGPIASVTQPANGTVVITGGGAGLTYQPDPNYCNSQPGGTPDTFTYTLNGGSTAPPSRSPSPASTTRRRGQRQRDGARGRGRDRDRRARQRHRPRRRPDDDRVGTQPANGTAS